MLASAARWPEAAAFSPKRRRRSRNPSGSVRARSAPRFQKCRCRTTSLAVQPLNRVGRRHSSSDLPSSTAASASLSSRKSFACRISDPRGRSPRPILSPGAGRQGAAGRAPPAGMPAPPSTPAAEFGVRANAPRTAEGRAAPEPRRSRAISRRPTRGRTSMPAALPGNGGFSKRGRPARIERRRCCCPFAGGTRAPVRTRRSQEIPGRGRSESTKPGSPARTDSAA